ncbi:MAG: hypothetical protein AABX80_00970 [Nanoarchaeota archaeon]
MENVIVSNPKKFESLKNKILNENIEKDLDIYKKKFDVVITNDSNMNHVNEIIKQIN